MTKVIPADLIRASVSANTQRAYRHAIEKLEEWRGERTLDDAVLAEYIAHLHAWGKAPATISQVVAAVKWYAKYRGEQTVAGAMTERTLAGIRRAGRDRGRGQVDGLDWQAVEKICALAESTETLSGVRDVAMMRLMSDCLLRVGEVVAVNVEDIKKSAPDKSGFSTLTLHQSKTDQAGVGETLFVGPPTLEAIARYREWGGIEDGALFRRVRFHEHIGEERLSVDGARAAIKARAQAAGVEGFISGHSLRIGSAISLAQAGASVVEMQVAGRWKSPQMPAYYARGELADRSTIARFKYRR